MLASDTGTVERFWHTVATVGTEHAKTELQEWIAKHQFSSHMRILARK